MPRRTCLSPSVAAEIEGDPRFRAAVGCRPSEGWRLRGACRTADADQFFPELLSQQQRALAVCAGCPVVDSCLGEAIRGGVDVGVWGGTSAAERRRMIAAYRDREPAAA